jgi:hypothetical protein
MGSHLVFGEPEDERQRRTPARAEEQAAHRPPVAERVLQLQRASGNQAVARLLQRQRRLDRLVGFEAELSVPSIGPPAGVGALLGAQPGPEGGAATANVEAFLRGGLPYGASAALGNTTANFQLKADHNELQTLHKAIRDKLATMGFLVPARRQTMSNLEYVTVAEDEFAPASTSRFRTIIDAVRNHANAMFPAVTGQMSQIAAPGGGAYTGIPEADFQAWLGSRYNEVAPEIQAFKRGVVNEFYLQATVGIKPSAIGDLFKSRTPWIMSTSVFEDAADVVVRTVKSLSNTDQFKNNGWVSDLKTNYPVDYDAFVGLLHLIFSYMVGSAINRTNLYDGSSEKNAVPFLSKLTNMGVAMQLAVPDRLRTHGVPENVKNLVHQTFVNSQYRTLNYWKQAWDLQDSAAVPARGGVFGGDFVRDVLSGGNVAAVNSGRTFAAPDVLQAGPAGAGGAAGVTGERGIPLEYRYISDRPDANGLYAALMKVVREARELNSKHMSATDKRNLIDAADV